MAHKIEAILEFYDIIDRLKELTVSSIGKERVDAMEFTSNREKILRMQQETEEAFQLLVTRSAPPLSGAGRSALPKFSKSAIPFAASPGCSVILQKPTTQ